MSANKVRLMLDSGVFSAWNRGEVLDLKRYIKYIKDHKQWLWSYVNMDKIPGKFGQPRTTADVEDSAKVGYDNLQAMKADGLKPIPVFHQGESFKWLERMLHDGERYIGISTAKDLNGNQQRDWLDRVFSLLTNDAGQALIKTHGFGITNPKFLFRYPWFTCDSTTWSMTPGYGQIIVPVYVNGKPDYKRVPLRIAVSGVKHTNKASQKRQFEAMGPLAQAAIRSFIEDVAGVTVPQARYGTTIRRQILLAYYMALEPELRGVVFKDRSGMRMTQFSMPKIKRSNHEGVTLIYATTLSNEWSDLMNRVGVNNRLLSYYEIKDRDSEILTSYVEKGAVRPYVPRPKKMDFASEAYLNQRRMGLLKHLETGEHE